MLELLAFTVGLAALVAIFVLLNEYNGQRNPQLPISLNVMASLIGAVATACSLFGAHSGIAQLKWLWFARGRPRPLLDFAPFHEARGGPFGAAKALFSGVL